MPLDNHGRLGGGIILERDNNVTMQGCELLSKIIVWIFLVKIMNTLPCFFSIMTTLLDNDAKVAAAIWVHRDNVLAIVDCFFSSNLNLGSYHY